MHTFFLQRLILVSMLLLFWDDQAHCTAKKTESEVPSSAITVIQNVNVIPMHSEVVLTHRDVVIKNDRIVRISTSMGQAVPHGAKLIDGTGKWLIPGLADMHIHITPGWMSSDWPVNPLKLYLSSGVTSVRCLGPSRDATGTASYVLGWRRKIAEDRMVGPVIYTSGPILFGPLSSPEAEIERQASAGYDLVKLYSYLSPKEFAEATAAAKSRGFYIAGHIPLMVGLDSFLAAGTNEIVHIEELAWGLAPYDRNRRDITGRDWIMYAGKMLCDHFSNDFDLSVEQIIVKYQNLLLETARKLSKAGVSVSTTLFLDQIIVDKLSNLNDFLKRPEVQQLPATYLKSLSSGKEKHQIMFQQVPDFPQFKKKLDLAMLWALKEANVRLVAGTDSGTGGMGVVPGYSLHEELKILVGAGFTPYEALSMATVSAAQTVVFMTGRREFGSISPGMRADLVLLGSNPLKNIDAVEDIRGVMAAGRWYNENTIRRWKRFHQVR